MKFILGKKLSMTQRFNEHGVVPVTIVAAGPCTVTQVKGEKDGYRAIQIGFNATKKRVTKSLAGHLKGLPTFKVLKEFRTVEDATRGQHLSVAMFKPGDKVQVTGISKGKGFQGVVKRHHFGGSPKTHGHKDQHRMPGSIGPTEPKHVFKGTRMGGHMGSDQVTVKNLEIIEVDEAQNLLYIKGAVPGARNNVLAISGEGDAVFINALPETVAAAEAPVIESAMDTSDAAAEQSEGSAAPVAQAPEAAAEATEPPTEEIKPA